MVLAPPNYVTLLIRRESVPHEKTEQPTPTCPMLTTCVPPVAGDSVPELDFTATSAHTREVQQHTSDTVSSSSTMDSYYYIIIKYLLSYGWLACSDCMWPELYFLRKA